MNEIPPDIVAEMRKAQECEELGRLDEAERLWLKMATRLPDGTFLKGSFFINLGQLAQRDQRLEDAEAYYDRAACILEGQRGEAFLECGHAYLNVARVRLTRGSERTGEAAQEAVRKYESYPFSPAFEVAEAKAIVAITSSPEAALAAFEKAWRSVRSIRCSDFKSPVTHRFVSEYERLLGEQGDGSKEQFRSEVRAWSTMYVAEALPQSHPLIQALLRHERAANPDRDQAP